MNKNIEKPFLVFEAANKNIYDRLTALFACMKRLGLPLSVALISGWSYIPFQFYLFKDLYLQQGRHVFFPAVQQLHTQTQAQQFPLLHR